MADALSPLPHVELFHLSREKKVLEFEFKEVTGFEEETSYHLLSSNSPVLMILTKKKINTPCHAPASKQSCGF